MIKQAAIDKIGGMTKAQVKSLLENIDLGMANEELRPYADARMAQLTPKSNPLFPKQGELDKLISQRDGLNSRIKALAEEAQAGGFAFKTEATGRMRNSGRPSKQSGSGAGKRGNAGDLVITVDSHDYESWKAVCDAIYPTLVDDKAAKGTAKDNIGWRAEAYKVIKAKSLPVTLEFKSAEKFGTYKANQDAGLGWLPEGFTVVKSF